MGNLTGLDHDLIVEKDGRKSIVKGDSTGRPHAVSCLGCRRESVCHGCGKAITRLDRCTSGACPSCCYKLHKHPKG